jgi:hypothetical protein
MPASVEACDVRPQRALSARGFRFHAEGRSSAVCGAFVSEDAIVD